jgi:hypothetical protein
MMKMECKNARLFPSERLSCLINFAFIVGILCQQDKTVNPLCQRNQLAIQGETHFISIVRLTMSL